MLYHQHPSAWPRVLARLRQIVVAATMLSGAVNAAPAVAQRPDSVPIPARPLFTRTDLVYAGAFALVGAAMAPIDLRIAVMHMEQRA